MSAQMLEVSLLGVGALLLLKKEGCVVSGGQIIQGEQQMSTLPPPRPRLRAIHLFQLFFKSKTKKNSIVFLGSPFFPVSRGSRGQWSNYLVEQ